MSKIKKLLIELIPNQKVRNELRKKYKNKYFAKTFLYNGKEYFLFQHHYNCGFYTDKMTERALEMALAEIWLSQAEGEVLEIGAVSPYYFPRAVNHICDPFDSHAKVDLHCSMFALDLHGKNILSISTIEHIATGDYGVDIVENESSVLAFEKIVKEAKSCFITFPVGYNKELDMYFAEGRYKNLSENFSVVFYVREDNTNNWKQESNLKKIEEVPYDTMADGVVIVIK